LASQQEGVVSRRQLLAAGLSRATIDQWVRGAGLVALHRGIYLVASPLVPPRARVMAATLAIGTGAAVSHRTAAGLWAMLPSGPAASPREVDVSVVRSSHPIHRGIRLHQSTSLLRSEVRHLGRIPVTSPVRTIVDIAATSAGRDLERILAEAQASRLVSGAELGAQIERSRSRPGIPRLRALLAASGGPRLTRSEAEERLLALIDEAGLARPLTNSTTCGLEVDFVWPGHGVAVEVDGFAFHSSRDAFERDRERTQILSAAGYQVVRVSWRQIVETPAPTIARLASVLGRAATPPRESLGRDRRGTSLGR